ncbi:MAG: hypothetical protein DMG30_11925 [Acidobacteria bacterium]|nr:MAG: hypothetical protein DMG30_11925 [Acidobacteriota bacterium]
MNVLTNAIESIQVGVEDYQLGTRPRLLSAVRNIHAGILLLFKEALREVSPPCIWGWMAPGCPYAHRGSRRSRRQASRRLGQNP